MYTIGKAALRLGQRIFFSQWAVVEAETFNWSRAVNNWLRALSPKGTSSPPKTQGIPQKRGRGMEEPEDGRNAGKCDFWTWHGPCTHKLTAAVVAKKIKPVSSPVWMVEELERLCPWLRSCWLWIAGEDCFLWDEATSQLPDCLWVSGWPQTRAYLGSTNWTWWVMRKNIWKGEVIGSLGEWSRLIVYISL